MICPACNYELLLHNGYCENCGAPAYLVTATQIADITHCTYCGARDERGGDDCATCGLKKNYKSYESLIGTCRNCGVAWRSVWMFCQTCGVARENGLVDTVMPITVGLPFERSALSTLSRSFQPTANHNHVYEQYESSADSHDTFAMYSDFDSTAETEMQPLLSENEVVNRMYANGENEDAVAEKLDLKDFFSESEVADSRQPRAVHQLSLVEDVALTDADVVNDFPLLRTAGSAVIATELQDHVTQEQDQPAASAQTTTSLLAQKFETSRQTAVGLSTTAMEATTPALTPVSHSTTKLATGAVQTVRVVHRSTPLAPPIDRKLIKIIAILILLVLLFSALIVSGFRLRDLFGKPQSQPRPLALVNPLSSPIPPDQIPPAPEGMVYVPGGVFSMGRDDGDAYEAPPHQVTMTPFFMDRTEVTNAQYTEFVQATKHRAPPDWKGVQYSLGTENFPVVNVSWQDASDYAVWAGKRLPTEAEWEYAARTKDGRQYPWGATWDTAHANTSESNLNHPFAVGSKPGAVNPLGLLDLAGNVWEWTAGEVTSYKDSNIILAPGKVIRGGAFYAPKERATTTFRGFAPPDKQAIGIGFRCVKEVN